MASNAKPRGGLGLTVIPPKLLVHEESRAHPHRCECSTYYQVHSDDPYQLSGADGCLGHGEIRDAISFQHDEVAVLTQ